MIRKLPAQIKAEATQAEKRALLRLVEAKIETAK